jgi:hypothetical protein
VIIADEVSLAKAINTRTMRESALAERIIQFTTMKR